MEPRRKLIRVFTKLVKEYTKMRLFVFDDQPSGQEENTVVV